MEQKRTFWWQMHSNFNNRRPNVNYEQCLHFIQLVSSNSSVQPNVYCNIETGNWITTWKWFFINDFNLQGKIHQTLSPCNSEIRQNQARQKEIKIAKTFTWVIVIYFICYTPLNINLIIVDVTKNVKFFQENEYLRAFHVFSICIAHVNSAINVFIYAYKIKDIRNRMKEVICCRKYK